MKAEMVGVMMAAQRHPLNAHVTHLTDSLSTIMAVDRGRPTSAAARLNTPYHQQLAYIWWAQQEYGEEGGRLVLANLEQM